MTLCSGLLSSALHFVNVPAWLHTQSQTGHTKGALGKRGCEECKDIRTHLLPDPSWLLFGLNFQLVGIPPGCGR